MSPILHGIGAWATSERKTFGQGSLHHLDEVASVCGKWQTDFSPPVLSGHFSVRLPFYTGLRPNKRSARAEMGTTERLRAVAHFLSSPPWCPLGPQGALGQHRVAVLAVILQYAWPDSRPRWRWQAGQGGGVHDLEL